MENTNFLKAEELVKNEQYEAALKLYDLAVQAETENPVYISQRAVCYFHLKDLDRALEDMNTAVRLDPEYSYRYASRAYIKDGKGDLNGAIEDYKKAVELDPEDAVSFNNLGLLEEKLGYVEASKKNFKKADQLAKLLEDTGIVTENELNQSQGEKPENIQKIIDEKKEASESSSIQKEIKSVFSKKESFKEFISFIINGFKSNPD